MKASIRLFVLLSVIILKTNAQYAEFAIPESEMWITEYNANRPHKHIIIL